MFRYLIGSCIILSKDKEKKFDLNLLSPFSIIKLKIRTATTEANKKIPHFILTAYAMPNVRSEKNITSSKGFLTGFLNLTIDNAPIIPNESAKLFEITFVITNATNGSSR